MFSLSSIVTASPRRLLIVLGGLTLSSAVAIGSAADFNATSANPGTLITAGTVVISNSASGKSVLNATLMKPGSSSSGTVEVQNAGNVPAGLALAKAGLADTPTSPALSAKLILELQDLGDPACVSACPTPVTLYTGALGAMATLALGTLPATATHRYRFTVSLPDGADGAQNAFQGATTRVDYVWTATQ